MFSNMYGYYNIHSENYSQSIGYEKLVKIIMDQNCFVQEDVQVFKNNNNFPWIDIGIVYTEDGNYSITNKKINEINLITIVTSKKDDQLIYINKLLKISNEINWKLYLEDDGEGNEDIEIK